MLGRNQPSWDSFSPEAGSQEWQAPRSGSEVVQPGRYDAVRETLGRGFEAVRSDPRTLEVAREVGKGALEGTGIVEVGPEGRIKVRKVKAARAAIHLATSPGTAVATMATGAARGAAGVAKEQGRQVGLDMARDAWQNYGSTPTAEAPDPWADEMATEASFGTTDTDPLATDSVETADMGKKLNWAERRAAKKAARAAKVDMDSAAYWDVSPATTATVSTPDHSFSESVPPTEKPKRFGFSRNRADDTDWSQF